MRTGVRTGSVISMLKYNQGVNEIIIIKKKLIKTKLSTENCNFLKERGFDLCPKMA